MNEECAYCARHRPKGDYSGAETPRTRKTLAKQRRGLRFFQSPVVEQDKTSSIFYQLPVFTEEKNSYTPIKLGVALSGVAWATQYRRLSFSVKAKKLSAKILTDKKLPIFMMPFVVFTWGNYFKISFSII